MINEKDKTRPRKQSITINFDSHKLRDEFCDWLVNGCGGDDFCDYVWDSKKQAQILSSDFDGDNSEINFGWVEKPPPPMYQLRPEEEEFLNAHRCWIPIECFSKIS